MTETATNNYDIYDSTDPKKSAETKQLISFGAAFLAAFNLLFFGPIDIYLTNIKDLVVSSSNVIIPAAIISVITIAVIYALLYLLKGTAHITAVNIVTGLSLALYVQGNYLQTNAVLDGSRQTINILPCIINLVIWGICICIPFLVHRFFKEFYTKAVGFLVVIICVMETSAMIASIAVIISEDDTAILRDALMNRKDPYIHSQENEFNFSSSHNIIIVLADEYDSFCFDSTIETDPESTAAMKDFTYYKDTVGMYGNSRQAIDHIFSGKLENESTYPADLFDTLSSNDYSIDLYITNNDVLPSDISEKYANNYEYNETTFSDIVSLNRCIYTLVGYKYSPFIMRPLFYLSNAEISGMISSGKAYYPDDLTFYNAIPHTGTASEEKLFKFYYLYGIHDPRNITKDLRRAPDWSISAEEQSVAVNKIFSEFLDMLKRTGVYDNSDIVFLADHGIKNHEEGRYPLLMIKRAGETHNALEISPLMVSYEQLFPTLVKLAGGDTGEKTVFDLTPEDNETRYYDHTKEYINGSIK